MAIREGIGFQYLSVPEKQVYKAMLKAFSSMDTFFRCPLIGKYVNLMKVLHTALGDNPSIIYFNKTNIKCESTLMEKRVFLSGVHPRSHAEKMNLAMDEAANNIISSIKAKISS